MNTTAGAKRRAEYDDDNASKRSRIGEVPKTGVNRSAAELDGGRAKRAKSASFMDHLNGPDEEKAAAADGVSAGSKTATEDSNQKAGGQSGKTASKAKADPALDTVGRMDNKNDGAKQAKAKATVKSPTPATQQTGEVKRSKADIASSPATIKQKAAAANTSKANAKMESGPTSDTKAEQTDGIAKSGPSPKRVGKQPAAGSEKVDIQKTKTQNSPVTSIAAQISATVNPKEEQTVKKVTAASPTGSKQEGCAAKHHVADSTPDKDYSPEKPATGGGVPPTAGVKRKADDEVSSPAKKPKLEARKYQTSLVNYSRACFMNASLHLLHSIPNFAVLENEGDEEIRADSILNREEMKSAVLGRGEPKKAACDKQREHLKLRKESGELYVSIFHEYDLLMHC